MEDTPEMDSSHHGASARFAVSFIPAVLSDPRKNSGTWDDKRLNKSREKRWGNKAWAQKRG